MTRGEREAGDDEAVRALAESWPRPLIDAGGASSLAERWIASRRAALAAGRPAYPHHALTPALATALFEARRARRVVRGLEAAEEALSAQALGVELAAGPTARGGARRISRLLLISSDGSNRFYRNVDRLARNFGNVLEVLVGVGDELELGAIAFGPGQRARALLVDHKEAVARVLGCLEEFIAPQRVEI